MNPESTEVPELRVLNGGGTRPYRTRHLTGFEQSVSKRQLGLWILLASIAMLFASTVVGFLVVRARTPGWTTGSASLPVGLWASTCAVLLMSTFMELSVRAARAGRKRQISHLLIAATSVVALFLVIQVLNGWQIIAAEISSTTPTLYAFAFYLLTGTHAAHVVGGLVSHGLVLHHALRGDYDSDQNEGLRLMTQYWHFLGVVWIVLFALLLLTP